MLDPEDVEALDARMDAVGRFAYVAALESIAAVLEYGLPPDRAARILRQRADDAVRGGDWRVPASLQLVPDDVVDAEVEDDEPAEEKAPVTVQRLGTSTHGGRPVFVTAGGEALSPEMVAWLDRFDDRIRMSPHFVAAVNEAADNELPLLDDRTAQVVGQRARELWEQAERSGS
jgi:hypothetical protein